MEERGTHRNIPGWVMAEVNSVVSSIGYKLFTAKSWESHFLGGRFDFSDIHRKYFVNK